MFENIGKEIYQYIIKIHAQEVKKAIDSIPKFQLEAKHLEGSQLIANRQDLLSRLPKGGVAAELGVDQGDFSNMILTSNQPAKLHLVDVWDTDRYGEDKASHVKKRFETQIKEGSLDITRLPSVTAAQRFPDEYFDWVYIDTDHSYNLTINELRTWSKKVKPSGYLAGHDYIMGNFASGYKYGVIEAVAQFCVEDDWKIAYLTADYTESNSFALIKI